MRILVVGCGSMGKRHLRNLQALGEGELLVFRSRRENVAELEREFRVRSFFDLDSALSEAEAVVVANPTSLHVPVALEAARAGCDLFIEKPVSHTLCGLQELTQVVEAGRLIAQVGYQMRFYPMLRAVRQLVHAGEIGQVWGARAWAGQYLPDWHPQEDYRSGYMARRDLGGGVILTLSHELDYLRWLFGEVVEVTACAGQPSPLEMETESWADLTLRFQSGVLGQVHLDCLCRHPSRGLEIMGSDGTVVCDLLRSEFLLRRPGHPEPVPSSVPWEGPEQPCRDEMADFLARIRDRSEPAVPLREGIATLRVALAALEAAAQGRRVCLGP